MKVVKWSYMGLTVPMIEIEEELCTTTSVLAKALGCSSSNLRHIRLHHANEFLSVNNRHPKDLTAEVKEELGIKRLKKDALLWSEDDMICAAMLTRGDRSKAFRRELIEFIKQNARRDTVSKDEYRALKEDFENFKALVLPHLQASASQAGKSLRGSAETKHLRLVM